MLRMILLILNVYNCVCTFGYDYHDEKYYVYAGFPYVKNIYTRGANKAKCINYERIFVSNGSNFLVSW